MEGYRETQAVSSATAGQDRAGRLPPTGAFVCVPVTFARQAKALGLSPTQQSLVLALLSYARYDHWQCYPSVARLAKDVGLTDRSIQRNLRVLESKGLLVTRAHTTAEGGPASSLYDLSPLRTRLTRLTTSSDDVVTIASGGGDTIVTRGGDIRVTRVVTPVSPEEDLSELDHFEEEYPEGNGAHAPASPPLAGRVPQNELPERPEDEQREIQSAAGKVAGYRETPGRAQPPRRAGRHRR